jgi:hypothetical protein
VTILPQYPWNSSHWERPRGPRDTAEAGQRRQCNRIDSAEYPSVAQAGQRRKCHRIDLAECPSVAQAGQRRKCNRIDLSECRIVIRLGPQSSRCNRYPGWRKRPFRPKFRIARPIPLRKCPITPDVDRRRSQMIDCGQRRFHHQANPPGDSLTKPMA